METAGELEWFRGEIWRSLTRPRAFARGLPREHYGLAGVVVAVVAGAALSVGVDVLVLASKDIAPATFVARLIIDAGLLGVRLAISAAVLAWIASGAVRLLGRRAGSLDQLFTALTFALAPLILVPLPAVVVAFANTATTLAIAGAITVALVVRVVVGAGLNIRAILPPAIAAVSFAVVVVLGGLVLGDQINRLRFLSYAIAPQLPSQISLRLVSDFGVTPATGQRVEMLGYDLTLPAGWKNATSGAPGEAGRFESSAASLVVTRARGAALDTADSYADAVGIPQRVGMKNTWQERSVTRINGVVVVDDRYGGNYEGRTVVLRQFTAVPGAQGLALVYRAVEPADRDAALAEAASIAATWHITAEGR
jgi:hypothetical protein